jgi:hypothetical protein
MSLDEVSIFADLARLERREGGRKKGRGEGRREGGRELRSAWPPPHTRCVNLVFSFAYWQAVVWQLVFELVC